MGKFKIGLQLYSVREEMSENVEATLKQIAEMGYDCVEFAGYFGHSADEIKAMCDKYGLGIPSVHQKYDVFIDSPEESVSYLKTLGVKYCAIPWVSADAWRNDYDTLIDDFKKVSKILKAENIQLLYHNHDFEFEVKHNGKLVFDSIFDDLSADIICPELDTCWAHYAGYDPVSYINKFGEISKVLHLKDFECKNLASGPVYALIDNTGNETKNSHEDNGFEFRPTGHGRQDVKAIMSAAENTEIQYVIIEQDVHPERSALEDAKISIDYLRSIGY